MHPLHVWEGPWLQIMWVLVMDADLSVPLAVSRAVLGACRVGHVGLLVL